MHRNLADPDSEPTDEELEALSRAAFAHVSEARREADQTLKTEIERLRAQVLAKLHAPSSVERP